MNILFYIPAYRRREITDVCYTALNRLRNYMSERYSYSSSVAVVYSEEEDKQLAEQYGFHTFYAENFPVSNKFNRGMQAVIDAGVLFSHVWQLNSDNVLSNQIVDAFAGMFERGELFFGINKLYFYEPSTDRMMYYEYLDGCGIRVIHRTILESAGFCYKVRCKETRAGVDFVEYAGRTKLLPVIHYNPTHYELLSKQLVFALWSEGLNEGLDNNSMNNIYKRCKQVFPMRMPIQPSPFVVDIKSKTNIHTYDSLPALSCQYDVVGRERNSVYRNFPELKALRVGGRGLNL